MIVINYRSTRPTLCTIVIVFSHFKPIYICSVYIDVSISAHLSCHALRVIALFSLICSFQSISTMFIVVL